MPKLDDEYTVQVYGCAEGQVHESWITLKTIEGYYALCEELQTLDMQIIIRSNRMRVIDGRGQTIECWRPQ